MSAGDFYEKIKKAGLHNMVDKEISFGFFRVWPVIHPEFKRYPAAYFRYRYSPR